jgi:flagellar biosynthesis protein FlhB
MVFAMRSALAQATSPASMVGALHAGLGTAALALAVPLGVASLTAILIGLVQTQSLFTLETVRFDANRILPSAKRVFGRQAWTMVGNALIKVAVGVLVGYWTLGPWLHDMAGLCGAPASKVVAALGQSSKALGLRLAIAMLALGVADYLWQVLCHREVLRMTRDELKRERKETEGEPIHKAERQRVYRELLQPVARVEMADFIVVDSGFLAAAVRYDQRGQGAPIVMAKGEYLLAAKMVDFAHAMGVAVVEDAALARALMVVENGDEIPVALYQSVAEWLVQVADVGGRRVPSQGRARAEARSFRHEP